MSQRTVSTVLLAASIALATPSNATGVSGPKSSYDRMIATKVLRVGYIHYPPGFVRDPNKPLFSGIMHDVLMEIGRNAEINIAFVEEVGWGTMIEAIRSRRVDVVCTGLW